MTENRTLQYQLELNGLRGVAYDLQGLVNRPVVLNLQVINRAVSAKV